MNKSVKTVNGLMSHLRNKGININGSKDKQNLLNNGYYHCYKGYRFVKKSTNVIPYTSFKEIETVYDFDCEIKKIFYSEMMFIETSLKNRVLNIITTTTNKSSFYDIFNLCFNDYKSTLQLKKKKQLINGRNNTRDTMNKTMSKAYKNSNDIANHYENNGNTIPIWGIFELITFGDFEYFLKNIDLSLRRKVSLDLNINQTIDTSALIVSDIINMLKNLRNSIAHNNVIFDTRFSKRPINNTVKNLIFFETNIRINFDEICDYLILIVYILKNLGKTKTYLKKLVNEFDKCRENAKSNLSTSIYNKFCSSNARNKINLLKLYIKL